MHPTTSNVKAYDSKTAFLTSVLKTVMDLTPLVALILCLGFVYQQVNLQYSADVQKCWYYPNDIFLRM